MTGRAFGRTALVVAVLAAGCGAPSGRPSSARSPSARSPSAQPSSAQPSSAAVGPCGSPVVADALPAWARAGFGGDGSGVPHVFGRGGDILAVLFGGVLSAPPDEQRSNKILWVSRAPLTRGEDLTISARLDGAAETAERKVLGGPGPSTIDLPRAGCWHLSLEWSGHTDAMDLVYTVPAVRPSR